MSLLGQPIFIVGGDQLAQSALGLSKLAEHTYVIIIKR